MGGQLYGWKDRAYESIPKDCPMTRAVWLTAYWADQERKARVPLKERTPAAALSSKAMRHVAMEDFSLTPAVAAPGAGPN